MFLFLLIENAIGIRTFAPPPKLPPLRGLIQVRDTKRILFIDFFRFTCLNVKLKSMAFNRGLSLMARP